MTEQALLLLAAVVVLLPGRSAAASMLDRLASAGEAEAGRALGAASGQGVEPGQGDVTAGGSASEASGPGRASGSGAAEHASVFALLAVCLRAGMPVDAALDAVATSGSADPRTREALALVAGRLRLGTPADVAWESGDAGPQLRRMAEIFRRSARSGSSVEAALGRAAERLRAEETTAAVARAERAGVMIAGPLGLCFLPAFVVLGIAPVVAGLAGDLLPAT